MPTGGRGFTFTSSLVHPLSRGHLTLRSADPTEYPAIYANYLSNEADLQKLVEMMKLTRRLGQTKALAFFGGVEVVPGPRVQSDEEIAEYVRNNMRPTFHPVGTCKMGHDAMAVVDDQLRVHGVQSLRVVDASIMPTIPNSTINAPTMMVAEKAADLFFK